MAKYENHGLKETKSSFQLRGVVTGTKSNKFFKEGFGSNKNGVSVNFGVEFAPGKTAYLSLTGYPRKTVNYYKRGENGQKGTNVQVPWEQRKQVPGEGYNMIGIRLSTGKDEDGKNINETMIEYDAVNWIHDNLSDGTSVFVKGHMEWNTFERAGQTFKSVNLVPDQISFCKEIDFESDSFEEECVFDDMLVFSGIEQELDLNDKKTGRFVLTGYSINYRAVEPVTFIIEAENARLATLLKKNMKSGNAIQVHGRLNVVTNVVTETEDSDDGWGETSKIERRKATGPVIREYIVNGASPSTIDTETWSEDKIAAAIRKIKAGKKATEDFGDKVEEENVDDWSGFEDDPNEELPWD